MPFSKMILRRFLPCLASTALALCAGAASGQTATLTTNSLNFGNQGVGTASAPQNIGITNTGTAPLTLNSVAVGGPNRTDFAPLSGNCHGTLQPGNGCNIIVTFTPGATGNRTGTITVTDNDPTSPQLVSLAGTGVAGVASFSAASLNFGATAIGGGGLVLPLTVTNNGNGNLTVTNVSTAGDYSQTNNCTIIAANATCNISVTFSPTATWSRMGLLTMQTNAGALTVPLSGMGTSGGILSLSATSLTFPVQVVGTTSAPRTVTLTNTGSGNATLQSILANGDFAQTNNCPAILNAGANCTINISLTPTWPAFRKGDVVLTFTDPPQVQSITLSGQGKAAATIVGISPRQSVMSATQTVQFSATISGLPSTNISWMVDGVAGGSISAGTITANGLYTPPSTPGSHIVTAVDISSPTQTASATASVTNYTGTFTYHNDLGRTGQNLAETVLSTANVNPAQFGKLFSYALDGYTYAQPLYVANVSIPNQGLHNVIFAATEHDSVYALDADNKQVLWQVSFINPGQGVSTVPGSDVKGVDIVPEMGITGTPVIDPASGTLYVVAFTKELVSGTYQFVQRLHALDITTGAERGSSPAAIQLQVPGTGAGKTAQNQIPFNALTQNQRAGLMLLNGVVYVAWGSHDDEFPFHGWVVGFDANSLQVTGGFITSPNSTEGGIWQGGAAPAADSNGNIYFSTGNGPFDAASGGLDYGDSVVRLSPSSGMTSAADYFAPFNQTALAANNGDLASGGVLALPDQPGNYPHLLLAGGKGSTLYLANRDNLGGYSPTQDQVVQELVGVLKVGKYGINLTNEPGIRGVPAYWNSHIYVGAVADQVKQFLMSNGLLSTIPLSLTPITLYYPGEIPAVSSNGGPQAILWFLELGGFSSAKPAVLHAFDANNLGFEIYNSKINAPRDAAGPAVKFTVPTVANGKVFVPAQYELDVYGLLP